MKKPGRIIFSGIALVALAACGNPQFEEGFNRSFEKSTKESCVSSAAKTGAPADQIEPYCACFASQISALSTQEKINLDPASPKVKAAIEACRPK